MGIFSHVSSVIKRKFQNSDMLSAVSIDMVNAFNS